MVDSGAIVQFLISLLDILPCLTKVKISTNDSKVIFVSTIFDQKALSPGAGKYGNTLYEVLPAIISTDADDLCKDVDSYSYVLKNLIQVFREGR